MYMRARAWDCVRVLEMLQYQQVKTEMFIKMYHVARISTNQLWPFGLFSIIFHLQLDSIKLAAITIIFARCAYSCVCVYASRLFQLITVQLIVSLHIFYGIICSRWCRALPLLPSISTYMRYTLPYDNRTRYIYKEGARERDLLFPSSANHNKLIFFNIMSMQFFFLFIRWLLLLLWLFTNSLSLFSCVTIYLYMTICNI